MTGGSVSIERLNEMRFSTALLVSLLFVMMIDSRIIGK